MHMPRVLMGNNFSTFLFLVSENVNKLSIILRVRNMCLLRYRKEQLLQMGASHYGGSYL